MFGLHHARLSERADHVQAKERHDDAGDNGEGALVARKELSQSREAEPEQAKTRKLTPTTKNRVFTNTLPRGYSRVPSSRRFAVPPARYPT